ncbi:helix-turn-helix domain-containing protein [Collimonas sp.]|jgi:TetR/AcrR family transcriptional repressor of lmrAB and yxaGH operons|uniref:TetR/AcrR family transcriptional regulator n=1 Tax=Collimonas sp. TaxID=1963772 RepID=UPI002CE8900A|nr:helix-turn-helix domain-containing protein [Collimonas sp.]HWW05739.1 helix-turn-helix domain-containing protein [Collimonas sp.]
MPAATLTRDEVVERILAAFRRYGYEGSSLSRLSEATGLGRSSLYHYFPNGKEDMASAAMAAVGAWFTQHVLSTLNGHEAAAIRLQRFAGKLTEYYSNGMAPCLMDVFTIGEAGSLFQQHLGGRMRALMALLAAVAEEAGVDKVEAAMRAENAVVAIQGSLIVSRALDSNGPFLRMIESFPAILLGSQAAE